MEILERIGKGRKIIRAIGPVFSGKGLLRDQRNACTRAYQRALCSVFMKCETKENKDKLTAAQICVYYFLKENSIRRGRKKGLT